MIRINPPIPLLTAKGKGLAHFVTDYGVETNLIWTVFLENGEIWSFQNPDVRAISNETIGRVFMESEEELEKESCIGERRKELEEKHSFSWNNFPDKWPDEDMEYCIVKIQSDPCKNFIAKLSNLFGYPRDKGVIFSFNEKEFIYQRGCLNSLGFDQIIAWKRIL